MKAAFKSAYLTFKLANASVTAQKTETRIDKRMCRFYERLRKVDGRKVVYIREEQKKELKALVNKAHEAETETEGVSTQFEAKEFVFLASELIFEGQSFTPQDGDAIRYNGNLYYIVPGENGAYYDTTEAGEALVKIKGVLH